MPTHTNEGATIAYTDTGAPAGNSGAPTVVFGHGLLFSGWMFGAQVAALRDTYRCVTIDWRGQGDSPRAATGYDIDTLSRDAIALIEDLGVAPVHFVGLSMGGFVGQRIAARRPELVRSLVLLDTSAERESVGNIVQDALMAAVYRLVGPGPLRGPVARIMLGPTFRKDPASARVVDEWMAQLSRCDRVGIRSAVFGVISRKPVLAELDAIDAPTLVIVGVDDVPTPVARARTIADAIKGARLEVVEHAGHSSTIEQPEAVTALIRDFLAT
jgi:pimeloyl-ACP methyl ester carboxylesterase